MMKKLLFITASLFFAVEISAEKVTLTLYANGCEAANVITCQQGYPVCVTAHHDFGYYFEKWNDGNTDNPRSLTVTQDTAFMAIIAKIYSGQCGDNLTWSYQNEMLTISGEGNMWDYTSTQVPWGLFLDSIKTISLPASCTSLGTNCFQDVAGLNAITIPASVATIGANAFDGCRKLYDVYCYAEEPPVAETSSFENYNVYLHAPCDNLKAYQMDAVFGSFKYIQCMGADTVVTAGEVTVVPTATDVTITWPTENQASTYTIEITKEGVVFCTLIFDAQGRLTSIAFAPGRGANAETVSATATGLGFSFTVTGLTPGTAYEYSIVTKNEAGTTLDNQTGSFVTEAHQPMGMDEVDSQKSANAKVESQKFLRDGVLMIERNGIYYNAQGAVVE